MSLHALAHNMASKGRGPDSMLVHMAPREVAGLQSLAMAHGGSLTINPATGLPEAGFLSSLLPTLIGGALTVASGGALSPLMAGLVTGAGYTAATGSLKKGLLAGLGAYGGAGLGSGLSAAGAAEASVPGAAPVAPEATAAFTAEPASYAKFAPTESSFGAFGEAPLHTAPTHMPFGFENTAATPTQFGAFGEAPLHTPSPLGADALATATPAPAPTYAPAYGTETAKNAFQTQAADASITDNFKQAGKGLTSLFDSPAGRDAFLGQAAEKGGEATGVGGLSGLAKYGVAASTPMLLDQRSGNGYVPDTEQFKYKYDVNRNPDPQGSYTGAPTGERQWFTPRFTRLYADGGQTSASDEAQKYLMGTDTTGKTNDLTGASRQAYDYLMGNGPGYRPPIFTKSSLPAAYNPGQDVEGGITTLTAPEPPVTIPVIDTEPKYTADPYIFKPEPDPYEAEPEIDIEPEPEPEPMDTYEDDPAITARDADVPPTDTYVDDDIITARDADVPPMDTYEDDPSITARDADVPSMETNQPAETNQYTDARDTDVPSVTTEQPTVQEQPDGSATVTMPDYIAPDDTVIQQQESPVQNQPDGGATVTMPDNTAQDTFDQDTGTYVDVGDAGGDYGSSGDFGGGGGGDFGGGGGGRYMDQFDDQAFAHGGMLPQYATGGISNLGSYSDGGRLLKGPGDGVSDSIPATIGHKQPARLADGEFVIPARIVSELGNGSTDAGARKLYQMMDRIQAARKKTVGKNRVAVNSRADKMMPV